MHDFGKFNINHINLILLVSLQINAVCLYVPANERIIQTNANIYIKTKLCPDVKGKHANPNLPRGTISEVYLDWLTPTNGYTSKVAKVDNGRVASYSTFARHQPFNR